MSPSTIDTGFTAIGTDTGVASGSLSGTEKVDIALRSCTGTSGADGTFTITPNNNINLMGGAVQVDVTYHPLAAGDRSCIYDIKDFSGGTVVASFTVKGSTPPALLVTPVGSFGDVRWYDGARYPTNSLTFRVENSGYNTLAISSFSVTGTGFAPAAAQPGTASLGHNSGINYTIVFNPDTAGSKSGSFSVSANVPTSAVGLTGRGTNATIAVAPLSAPAMTTMNFGDVPVLSSGLDFVTVTNGAASPQGPLYVSNSTITGGNGWFKFTACNNTTCNLNATVLAGTPQNFGVTCTPPSGTVNGTTSSAMLTIGNDSDNQSANTLTLNCRAVDSIIGLAPSSTVDFGGVLVNTPTPATTTITVTNTGGASYGPFYFQRIADAGNVFSATCVTGCSTANCGSSGTTNQCTLGSLAQMTVQVTFRPTAEAPYAAGLVLNRGTGNASLSLAGRGIDKHIQVTDAVIAPDTFRCPGDKATLVPITITNTGEAPLSIDSLTVSGDPVWQVTEATPWIVDGCVYPCTTPGTRDLMVRFAPQAIGKAPTGQLSLMNDASPVSDQFKAIRLDGNGKERIVDMLPGVVPFGVTGAGVPVKLSTLHDDTHPLLTVENSDTEAFTIRSIVVGDGTSKIFTVKNLDGSEVKNVTIEPGQVKEFDVIFAPDKVGEFNAQIYLYLDSDCEPQRVNDVTGRAVFVDAHGSSIFGCAAGRGSGTGMLLIVIGLLFACRRRRR